MVADQFVKRGIVSTRVQQEAVRIIDKRVDLRLLEVLGMEPALLEKREKTLAELRSRLERAPRIDRPRQVLKKPQAFVMEVGDLFVYPTSKGKCVNSYYRTKGLIPGWNQDSWAAALIVDAGRAFEFLAWYRPLTIFAACCETDSRRGVWVIPMGVEESRYLQRHAF